MTITASDLTADTLATFEMYAEDAGNWSGNPYVTAGNISPTKAQRGNLADLVKKGLIEIGMYDGDSYVCFTDEGEALAKSLGYSIY